MADNRSKDELEVELSRKLSMKRELMRRRSLLDGQIRSVCSEIRTLQTLIQDAEESRI